MAAAGRSLAGAGGEPQGGPPEAQECSQTFHELGGRRGEQGAETTACAQGRDCGSGSGWGAVLIAWPLRESEAAANRTGLRSRATTERGGLGGRSGEDTSGVGMWMALPE